MGRNVIILGVLAIGLCIFGMFQVKYKVYNLKRDLKTIDRQLVADKDAIRVLKAEWSYLNKPERIEKLAERYLKLGNIQVAQIYSGKQVDNLYLASTGAPTDVASSASKPVLKPILSSARGYR